MWGVFVLEKYSAYELVRILVAERLGGLLNYYYRETG